MSATDSTVNCPNCRTRSTSAAPTTDVNAGYVQRQNDNERRGYNDARSGRAKLATSNAAYLRGFASGELEQAADELGIELPISTQLERAAAHLGIELPTELEAATRAMMSDHAAGYRNAIGTPTTSEGDTMTNDDAAQAYEDVQVQRQHSGTEDGSLWYVVDGHGNRVSGDGHIYRESAEAEAEDATMLAKLSDVERAAVERLRSWCPAPGDWGLAVIEDGQVTEYRQRSGHDRNEPASGRAKTELESGALADYRGSAAYFVTVDGYTLDQPTLATVTADLEELADGAMEVGAGEPSGDAREYVQRAQHEAAELVGILTMQEAANLSERVLSLAGYLRITGRVVSRTDDIGHTYAHGAVAIPTDEAERLAGWAAEWAAECQWSDDDVNETLRTLSPSTILTCAAAHYDGGLGALIEAARADIEHVPAKLTASERIRAARAAEWDDAPESNLSDMLSVPANPRSTVAGAFGALIDAGCQDIAAEAVATFDVDYDCEDDESAAMRVLDILKDASVVDAAKLVVTIMGDGETYPLERDDFTTAGEWFAARKRRAGFPNLANVLVRDYSSELGILLARTFEHDGTTCDDMWKRGQEALAAIFTLDAFTYGGAPLDGVATLPMVNTAARYCAEALRDAARNVLDAIE